MYKLLFVNSTMKFTKQTWNIAQELHNINSQKIAAMIFSEKFGVQHYDDMNKIPASANVLIFCGSYTECVLDKIPSNVGHVITHNQNYVEISGKKIYINVFRAFSVPHNKSATIWSFEEHHLPQILEYRGIDKSHNINEIHKICIGNTNIYCCDIVPK